MGSGIEIYNYDNILQITDKFTNIQFIEKTTVTLLTRITSYYANGVDRYYANVTLTALDKEMYAIRCDNGKFINWSGSRTILGSGNYGPLTLNIRGERDAIVTVYRFSYASIPSGNYFEVRNENGNIVFSDNAKFMKVIDSKSGLRTRPTPIGVPLITTSHSSNILTAVSSGYYTWEVDYDDYSFLGASRRQSFTFNPTETIYSFENYFVADSPNYHYDRRTFDLNYQYIVLDVTGL